jgi:hypothetical protein
MCKKERFILNAAILMAVIVVLFFPAMGTASTYDLSLTMTGTGKGTVYFSPGFECSDTCKQEYGSGTPVQLNAVAPSGVTFNKWEGCDVLPNSTTCIVYITNEKKAVSADFTGPSLIPGSVSGKITNNLGIGLYGAGVLMIREHYTSNCVGSNCIYAMTDGYGNYSINNVVPGTYIVNFQNPRVPASFGYISSLLKKSFSNVM